jgi:hypothetical protein
VLAVDLSDLALAAARDGALLSCAPAVLFEGNREGSTQERFGTPAWQALRRSPTAVSTGHLAAVLRGEGDSRAAALVSAELAQRLLQDGPALEDLWLAVPADSAPAGLSALLGITRTLGLPVAGFVDAAVAQVAALGLTQPALVLAPGLHSLAVCRIEPGGGHCQLRRVAVSPAAGWLALLASWAELAGRTLVKQTRFDPLHEGLSEQRLYDALPALVAQAQEQGAAVLSIAGPDGQPVTAMISRDQLAAGSQGLRRELMRAMHSLRSSGRLLCLLAPAALLTVPGLAEDLESLSGCELVTLPAGFAAQAASCLAVPARGAAEPVRLLRRLPLRAQPAFEVSRRALGQARAAAPPPSHVLLAGTAHALHGAASLVAGCDPGATGLRLGAGLAGVSRRHCTFLHSGSEVVLLDHNRYGTFVNGERVAERVRVLAGDRVRLGDPGVELALIAVPP